MNERWKNYTNEELQLAKSASLIVTAKNCGYEPVRVGNNLYSLKEADSVRIYNDRSYARFSRATGGKRASGGSTIDFVKEFGGETDIVAIVQSLCEQQGYSRSDDTLQDRAVAMKKVVDAPKPEPEKHPFVLPDKADNYRKAYEYLTKVRCISGSLVDKYVNAGLLYQSKQHSNLVFLGRDKLGDVKFASQRGTYDPTNKPAFKCDVAGNDKTYGVNISNPNSDSVVVVEAAIDMMSYSQLHNDYDKTNKVALGMVSDAPLETFLKENPQIRKIRFGLDADMAGQKSEKSLLKKYADLGYEVDYQIPIHGKDWNEDLKHFTNVYGQEFDYFAIKNQIGEPHNKFISNISPIESQDLVIVDSKTNDAVKIKVNSLEEFNHDLDFFSYHHQISELPNKYDTSTVKNYSSMEEIKSNFPDVKIQVLQNTDGENLKHDSVLNQSSESVNRNRKQTR